MSKIITEKIKEKIIIPIRDMKTTQVGVVVNNLKYGGHVVMRTQNSNNLEVMDLTDFRKGLSWDSNSSLEVRILEKGEKIMFELSND